MDVTPDKSNVKAAKVPYLRCEDGSMYLCDQKGCPKAGQPLSLFVAKNHRKTFKKYGACFKSLNIKADGEMPTYQTKSKVGESVYPRKCANEGCPKGD